MKKKFKENFKTNRATLLIIALVVYVFITLALTYLYDILPIVCRFSVFSQDSFYLAFITNLYSGIIDFVIFTLVIWLFNQKLDKKDKIRKYQNEIDDSRFWMSDEAMHKIWGNIRRLQEMKIQTYDLSKCMLNEIKLKKCIFFKSKFMGANIKKSNLTESEFIESNFQGAFLDESNIKKAKLQKCNCNYLKAHLLKAHSTHISDCTFKNAEFDGADFSYAIFKDCDFEKVSFKDVCLYRANLKGAVNLTFEQLLQCKNIEYIVLDEKHYLNPEIRKKSKKFPPSK